MSEANQLRPVNLETAGETEVVRDERHKGFFWENNELIRDYGCKIGPNALAVYSCLAYHADNSRRVRVSYPSPATIAREIGSSRSTVKRALHTLVEWNIIALAARKSASGDDDSSLKILLPKEEWKPIPYEAELVTPDITPDMTDAQILAALKDADSKITSARGRFNMTLPRPNRTGGRVKTDTGVGSEGTGGRVSVTHKQEPLKNNQKEELSTTTRDKSLSADAGVDADKNSSFSSTENEALPMAVASSVRDNSSEPKNADGLAIRLMRWAESEGESIDMEKARRIVTSTTKAGSAVADLDRAALEARLRDFKSLKLPRSIHGTVADKLKRDVEYMRWTLWLWPLNIIDLGAWAQPGKTGGPDLCSVFVARAGLSKGGDGEKAMQLPKSEFLAALLHEDAAKSAAIEREKQNAREIAQRAHEREAARTIDAEIAEMSPDDRRALIEKATAIVPNLRGITDEGGKPNAAVIDEMRHLWSSGWTPEQNHRSATLLRADAATADFMAALDAMEPSERAEIEAEARLQLAPLNMKPETLARALPSRCQSVMMARIKAGAEFLAPPREAQRRAA